jgi:hypothetical protein
MNVETIRSNAFGPFDRLQLIKVLYIVRTLCRVGPNWLAHESGCRRLSQERNDVLCYDRCMAVVQRQWLVQGHS